MTYFVVIKRDTFDTYLLSYLFILLFCLSFKNNSIKLYKI